MLTSYNENLVATSSAVRSDMDDLERRIEDFLTASTRRIHEERETTERRLQNVEDQLSKLSDQYSQ